MADILLMAFLEGGQQPKLTAHICSYVGSFLYGISTVEHGRSQQILSERQISSHSVASHSYGVWLSSFSFAGIYRIAVDLSF